MQIKNDYEKYKKENSNEELNMECSAAMMAIDVPPPRGPIFVFGDYFLRKFYTVFDRDQRIVGISRANHNADFDIGNHLKTIFTPYDTIETKGKEINNKFNTSAINILSNKSADKVVQKILHTQNNQLNKEIQKEKGLDLKDLLLKLNDYPEFLEIDS